MSLLLRGIYLPELPDAVLTAALEGNAAAFVAVMRARRAGALWMERHGAPGELALKSTDAPIHVARLSGDKL